MNPSAELNTILRLNSIGDSWVFLKKERYMTKLVRLEAVKSITGRSRSSIYADPEFPRPVKIGPRAVAWVEDEIHEWVRRRIQERGAD